MASRCAPLPLLAAVLCTRLTWSLAAVAGVDATFPLAAPAELATAPCEAVAKAGEAAMEAGEVLRAAGAFALAVHRWCGQGSALNNLAVALASLATEDSTAPDVPMLCEALAAAQLSAALGHEQAKELVGAVEGALGPAKRECFAPPLADERAAALAEALARPRERGQHLTEAHALCASAGAAVVAPTAMERERGMWSAVHLRTILGLLYVCGVVAVGGLLPTPLVAEVRTAWELRAGNASAEGQDAARRGRGRLEARLPLEPPFAAEGLADGPLLLGLVRLLVGERAELDTFSAIRSEPGSPAQPWHCDAPVPALRPAAAPLVGLVAVVPLDDLGAENGATEFLAGSHVDMGDERFWAGGDDGDGASDAAPKIAFRARAGSVLLFDLRLRHRGGANRAASPRSVLYMSYVQDWFRDATNFRERQTRAWDALPPVRRRLFARLDQRRYVQRLEELTGGEAAELRGEAEYAPGQLEL